MRFVTFMHFYLFACRPTFGLRVKSTISLSSTHLSLLLSRQSNPALSMLWAALVWGHGGIGTGHWELRCFLSGSVFEQESKFFYQKKTLPIGSEPSALNISKNPFFDNLSSHVISSCVHKISTFGKSATKLVDLEKNTFFKISPKLSSSSTLLSLFLDVLLLRSHSWSL